MQFMWGFQETFRRDVQYRIEDAFKAINVAVAARFFLIGFAESTDAPNSICVEPEAGSFKPEDFGDVLSSADKKYAVDDDRRIMVTGDGQQDLFEARSLDKSRTVALSEALQESAREGDRQYFVGGSTRVAGFRVYPVVSVLRGRWAQIPLMPHVDDSRTRLGNSLPEELIHRTLMLASVSLANGEQPSELVSSGRDVARDLVNVAASAFAMGVSMRVSGMPSELKEVVDMIASTPYEGRPTVGRIVIAPANTADQALLQFDTPVPLSRTRQARKLVEMSGPERYLLSDGHDALGLVNAPAQPAYEIALAGKATWTLSYNGVDYLRVINGRPALPTPPLDRDLFRDNFARLFGEGPELSADTIWGLTEVAGQQEHGTMLVIHRNASEESARLGRQAVPVQPTVLSAESLDAASRIDGAVLIAPDGRCHAIGVILDGIAGDSGDPGRGARFNSAARYIDANRDDCLILVVSEDGSIELVPPPRRRLTRSFIGAVVQDVIDASGATSVDFETFNRYVTKALAHAFYFDDDQCAAVTAARVRVEEVRMAESRMSMHVPALRVDPTMNETYFFSE